MHGSIEGRVALVTGGAGSIGAAAARVLAGAGARVVLADRDADGMAAVVGGIGEERAVARTGDVTDSAFVRSIVDEAVQRFGGLDIAFANAGVFGEVASIVEYPEDVFDRVIAVNVKGPFLVCKHALRAMRDGGSVIINSSVVGLTSDAGICAYATSKHAVIGLMRTAMHEAAPRRIRVNTIHPGPVDNDFQHRIEMTATGADRDAASAAFEERIPLSRHATADEIAEAVLFLAGPGSAFITGATIAIDGGLSV